MSNGYQMKRKEWLKIISSDDNSIQHKLSLMLWDLAVYSLIIESRKYAARDGNGNLVVSAAIHNLIDDLFFQRLSLFVRAMVDESDIDGTQGVCSLVSLLKDMRRHYLLITRQEMLASESIEYDVDNIKDKREEFISNKMRSGERIFSIPRDLKYEIAEQRHNEISKLAGVTTFSPNDCVRQEIFTNLIDSLRSKSGPFKVVVDKFFAHHASEYSRQVHKADSIVFTFEELKDVCALFCKVIVFVSRDILGEGVGDLFATPSFDLFEHFDKPFIPEEKLPELEQHWEGLSRDFAECAYWGFDDYNKECNS